MLNAQCSALNVSDSVWMIEIRWRRWEKTFKKYQTKLNNNSIYLSICLCTWWLIADSLTISNSLIEIRILYLVWPMSNAQLFKMETFVTEIENFFFAFCKWMNINFLLSYGLGYSCQNQFKYSVVVLLWLCVLVLGFISVVPCVCISKK